MKLVLPEKEAKVPMEEEGELLSRRFASQIASFKTPPLKHQSMGLCV